MDHDWKKLQVTQPSLCFSCRKAIWAPFSSAVRCCSCSLMGHKACAKKTTIKCTKMAPQSFMAVGVVQVRVIAGLNMDSKVDCVCTLQLDQQTATTRVAFGNASWNQVFTFIVTSSSKRKLILECFEQEYMDNIFLGTCIVPNLHEYTQQEEIFADLQRGGVKTKMTLQLAIEYHRLYSHDVEWGFDTTFSDNMAHPTPVKGIGSATPARRLKRRHSFNQTLSAPAQPSTINSHIPDLSFSTKSASNRPTNGNTTHSNSGSNPGSMSLSLTALPSPPLSPTPSDRPRQPIFVASSHLAPEIILPPASQTAPPTSSTSGASRMVPSSSMASVHSTTEDEGDENEDSDEEDGNVVFRDHFGFPIEASHIEAYLAMFEFQFSTRMKEQAEYLAKHLNKMISCSITKPIVSREMIGFAKSGFPLSHRGDLWQALSGSRDAMKRHRGLYRKLLERHQGQESVATLQIEKDLHRTFISNPMLRSKRDIDRLQRVLNAFSFYDPQTGYCQSLNFIAALFLLLMSEEEAFWLLVVTTRKYLPDYYTPDMVGSKTDAHIFEAMLYTYFPMIAHQLFDLGLPVVLRTASWFLCMFVTILPIETTMRIFDWMFVEGSQIIFSVGLALFDLSSLDLSQANSFDTAYFTFTTMTQHCYNADHLIELASSKYLLVRKEISALRSKLRLEYARRDEQELLSSLNLSPDDFYALVSQIEGVHSNDGDHPHPTFLRSSAKHLNASSASSLTSSSMSQLPEEPCKPENAELEAGVLDKAKFVAVFTKLFPDIDSTVAHSVFDTLDSDEDSALTIKECLLGISAFVVGEPDKKALMWFRVFDKNNDGVLDTSEIRALLSLVWKLIDKQLDHSWIDAFLKVVETTHDGRITRQEFVAACLDMPVLSEWLKFGFTLGDRVKVLAAKEETAQHVAHHPDVPLPTFQPDDDDDGDNNDARIPLSSSPPHTWLDEDGKVNPILVRGTVSPRSHFSDDEEAGSARHRQMDATASDGDLEETGFYFV